MFTHIVCALKMLEDNERDQNLKWNLRSEIFCQTLPSIIKYYITLNVVIVFKKINRQNKIAPVKNKF